MEQNRVMQLILQYFKENQLTESLHALEDETYVLCC